jgi:hypothetical protein
MRDQIDRCLEHIVPAALLIAACALVAVALASCASTPIPECPPCPPGPTIHVPVPVPCDPIPVPPETPRPTCSGTAAEILRCVADYVQALRDEIATLRDEITAHNTQSSPTPTTNFVPTPHHNPN